VPATQLSPAMEQWNVGMIFRSLLLYVLFANIPVFRHSNIPGSVPTTCKTLNIIGLFFITAVCV
jgi:hypothetical protein